MSCGTWHFFCDVYPLVICQTVTMEVISQITGVHQFTIALTGI
jgi:hypothetical protein